MAGSTPAGESINVDITTGIGTLSFPHIFESTKTKTDKGEDSYNIQFIIPKSDRAACRDLLLAVQKVGKAKWGDNWKKFKQPIRDGDAEADKPTQDGLSTNGEKYPERLGCFFFNARSSKPVGVVDRDRVPITNPNDVYGGCKGRIAVSFYTYNTNGNIGIAASLNGVQKVNDGKSFGSGKPSIENMFDMLDDSVLDALEDDGSDDGSDEGAEEQAPAAPPAKKAAAKKATAKKAAAPEPVDLTADDDLDADLLGGTGDEDGDDGGLSAFDNLDDSDA